MAGRTSKPGQQYESSDPKKFKAASHEAAGSIQPHMLYSRREIRKLVMAKLSGGVHPAERTEKEPFRYSVVDGMMYVNLSKPILRSEVKEIIEPISEAIGRIRQEYRSKEDIKRKYLARGEYPAEVSMPPELDVRWPEGVPPSEREKLHDGSGRGDTLMSRFPLLVLTSKMGCMSFNLPAGPAAHQFYGTCVASAFGFPMLKDEERPKRGSKWFDKASVDKGRFLCSGCYGLKGLYGSPLIFTMMECRKQWVETMIQPRYRKDMASTLVKAIRMAQAQSITSRYMLREMKLDSEIWSIPDPAYFRIHDVGDLFHEAYLEVWFDVIRQCSKPMEMKQIGFTLPAIKFWMPSRAWIVPGKVSEHFICRNGKNLSCVPDNLVIRPSAVHFGDPAPDIKDAKGLSFGATSTSLGEALTEQDIHQAEKVVGKLYGRGGNGWVCPAYLAPEQLGGGGAEWVPAGGKKKSLQLVGGACVRAFGPDGEPPAPKGKGCRACWDRPDLKILYPEH